MSTGRRKKKDEPSPEENREAKNLGNGNPNHPTDARMRDELYNKARELKIPDPSKMTKRDLARAMQPVPAARLPHPKVE